MDSQTNAKALIRGRRDELTRELAVVREREAEIQESLASLFDAYVAVDDLEANGPDPFGEVA